MYLLLAASVEGTKTSQTHRETVNAKEVELKVMYILIRARILQIRLDVLDLCVFCCLWLQSRSDLSSSGVVLMSYRVNFHLVRSALQYSACRI